MKLFSIIFFGISSKKGFLYYWLSIWAFITSLGLAPLIKLSIKYNGNFFTEIIFYFLPLAYALTSIVMVIYFILKAHSQDIKWLTNKIIDTGNK